MTPGFKRGKFTAGGVSATMYGKLPIEITSVHGFEGCLANIAVNGEALDPVESALIPSPLVSEGCRGEIFYC